MMLIDEKGQISAEMILLMGGVLVIVLIVAMYVTNIARDVSNSIGEVVKEAEKATINRL